MEEEPPSPLFYLPALIKGHMTEAMVDSGSGVNAIDEAYALSIGCHLTNLKRPLHLRFGNGTQVSVTKLTNVYMRLGSRLTIRVQLRVIPHMPVCNVILGSRFLRHYDPIIRWSKGYMRIHGVRIPFLDCELPSQELQRAGVLVVDPTPTPINDIFGDEDPCLHESSSSPGTFSVSPLLEDNEVVPIVFAEEPTYDKFEKILPNLPDDARFQLHSIGQFEKVSDLFDKFKILFPDEVPAMPLPHPDRCHKSFDIKVKSPLPRRLRRYRWSADDITFLVSEIQKMERLGMISRCSSEYASPCFVAKQKNRRLRLVVDFRGVNSVTAIPHVAMPDPRTALDCVRGCKYFTVLDLKSGFHQLLASEDAQEYLAFETPIGTFRWNVMPMGVAGAPAHCQDVVTDALKERLGRTPDGKGGMISWIDDIIIGHETLEGLIEHTEWVLGRLLAVGLVLNPDKCIFSHNPLSI